MVSTAHDPQHISGLTLVSIQAQIERAADNLLDSLPSLDSLSAEQRRGIIARYSAVLEGNFIYWMTGAYLAVRTDEARSIIIDNLTEEVRDAHPAMLRRFAIEAGAVPTDTDMQAVYEDLTSVRLFVGGLSAVRTLIMMAFFEGWIQRFMAYLADLAERQGSGEMEYTDVHGVCDIEHTDGLLRALHVEMAQEPLLEESNLFEGVELLSRLMHTVVHYSAEQAAGVAA